MYYVFLCFPSLPLFSSGNCCLALRTFFLPRLCFQVLKKNGVFHVPYRGTMIGAALGGGRELARNPLGPGETMDSRLEKKVRGVAPRVVIAGGLCPVVFSVASVSSLGDPSSLPFVCLFVCCSFGCGVLMCISPRFLFERWFVLHVRVAGDSVHRRVNLDPTLQ